MSQKYMHYIRWNLDLSELSTAEDQFSSKRMQKIRQSMKKIEESEYRFEFHRLTENLLDQFVALYNEFMGSKEGGEVHRVKELITKNQSERGRKYEILALWQGDKMIGGLVYGRKKNSFSIAFRVFPFKLDIKLSAGPAYIGEYLLVDRALSSNKSRIIHGRDRNAYGINADIGLAVYKMRLGAVPHVSASVDNKEHIVPENLDHDVLVCVGADLGEKCGELVLYTNLSEDEMKSKYPILSSYKPVPIRIEKR